MFTKQETFNQVYLGLASQGFVQSVSKLDSECLYRGPDGLKCAAGHIIPDDRYDRSFESRAILRGNVDESNPASFRLNNLIDELGHDRGLLTELQYIHDHHNDPDNMREDLEGFASRSDLTVPTIA